MTSLKDRATALVPLGVWRWWRLVLLSAAAGVAVIAWRWPALLDARAGSLIATTLTVLALAAAGIAFLRTTALPLAARLIASALAAYAVVALVQGTLAGATLSEMVRGASAWHPLPRWLRGAFIGGCLVLPLAAVVHAVKTGLRGWRTPSSTAWRELNAAIVYALCAATAFSTWAPLRRAPAPVSGATAFAVPATPEPAPVALPVSNSAVPADVDPVAFAQTTDALVASVSRVDWDVDARARALGAGVDPAFAYVRDAIRYESYPGVLRGAAGTYSAKAGNAVDRAILLVRLLEQKKINTRFAIGTLNPAVRERLWERIFDLSIPGIPRAASSTRPSAASADFRTRVQTRATRDYGVVRAALGNRLPPVTKPSHDDVLTEMNPHVWVQAQVDGSWVDLDPSFPDSKPGTTNTAIEQTVADLPADMYQTVAIRLKVEQLSHGELSERTVLDSASKAVDLVDRQIFIAHVAGTPIQMANLGASLGGYNTWTPALWVSGDFTYGKTFTIDESGGSAPAAAAGQPQAAGPTGMAGAIDALSASPTGNPTTAAGPTGPVFVAEWLEFELRAPGGQTEITRRVLADRGSAAWRSEKPLNAAGLNRLERADNGPTSMRALHNVWFSAGPHNLADYADAMQDLAYKNLDAAYPEDTAARPVTQAGVTPKESPDFGESVWPLALQNFAWMVWTDHGVIPRLNDTPGLRLYAARPRIAVFTIASDRDGTTEIQTDLRRDDLRGLIAETIQPGVLAEKKLWFGLLQGAFEHEMVADIIAASGGDRASIETTSARLSNDGVLTLAPADTLPSGNRPPHPESAARLTASLSAGNVIVAPVGALDARGSWWEIAPATGDTRAVGPLELHSSYGRGTKSAKAPQQNSYGGPRANHMPEARREAVQAGREARNKRRVAQNIADNNNKLARQNAKKPAGNEYGELLDDMALTAALTGAIIISLAVDHAVSIVIEAAFGD